MKKFNYFSVLFILSIFTLTFKAGFLKADTFPINELDFYEDKGKYKIIAFVPSLSVKCEYAEMMTTAFTNYFAKGLAFEKSNLAGANQKSNTINNDIIDVILILNDGTKPFIETYPNLKELIIKPDVKGEYYEKLNIELPANYNSSSTVFLLDNQNNILLKDSDYRGQGEHLKPLEFALKNSLSGYKLPSYQVKEYLKTGDSAPDININSTTKLSDYRGSNIVITFYPAAFSGVIPQSNNTNYPIMSCAVQLSSFNKIKPVISSIQNYAISIDNVKYIAISNSTPELLALWKEMLNTDNIEFVNDPDFKSSIAFNSYNPIGYSSRSTFIVDRNGIIKYISWDYTQDEEYIIESELAKLD